MDGEQPRTPETDTPRPEPDSSTAEQAYDRFVGGQTTLDQERGDRVEGPRPSRRSAWLAMAAVAVALGLLWLAPGVGHDTTESAQTVPVSLRMPRELHEFLARVTKRSKRTITGEIIYLVESAARHEYGYRPEHEAGTEVERQENS